MSLSSREYLAVTLLGGAVLWTGCAGAPKPRTAGSVAANARPTANEDVPESETPPSGDFAEGFEQGPATEAEEKKPSLRHLCRAQHPEEAAKRPMLDKTRTKLEETFCSATLWFDGLLGGQPDLDNARSVAGRLEVNNIYSEYEGYDPKVRLRLKYDLPNLENRVNLFLGREDEEEFVQDRQQTFPIRSSVFDLETEDRWLAGLGYSPPGKYTDRLDFRVGGRVKSAPEIFLQGRLRRNYFVGANTVWRLRETVFYENRDGFGSTTSADLDYVLKPDLLLRWGNVGTFSEATTGLNWRSRVLIFQNLRKRKGIAYEGFIRGSTDSVVPIREYGIRGVYRQPVFREYFFGLVTAGYSFPRRPDDEAREGSAIVGIGIELHFGDDPY
ncbi:MAG: hypothetical protein AAF481_16630 [Acidobacteriota bacterium]